MLGTTKKFGVALLHMMPGVDSSSPETWPVGRFRDLQPTAPSNLRGGTHPTAVSDQP